MNVYTTQNNSCDVFVLESSVMVQVQVRMHEFVENVSYYREFGARFK